ncbi:MAG: hypothetical protein WDZ52_03915 [Pseudohongiellaceae bacterium]
MNSRNLRAQNSYFTIIRQKTLCAGFFDDACKDFYLKRLLYCQHAYQVQLHAYVLMEREILLLFTPLAPSSFDTFIRFLNTSYNGYYFIRFERRVQAWRNRVPICLLPNSNLVLDCQKYIERYVLKSECCNHPGEYRYSSYCSNAFFHKPKPLQQHRAVFEFMTKKGNTLESYREFIASPFIVEYERFLQSRLLKGRPLLSTRTGFRFEKTTALTDIKKDGTIASA